MLTDLNLTRVFVAIYEAGSLTAAGRRLFVTQSAISQSLARLRRELGDPLFERTAQGMRPTALADAIYPELHEGMSVIDRTIAAVTGFDPLTSERTFRIALSELGEIGWLPAIGDAMALGAPRALARGYRMSKSSHQRRLCPRARPVRAIRQRGARQRPRPPTRPRSAAPNRASSPRRLSAT